MKDSRYFFVLSLLGAILSNQNNAAGHHTVAMIIAIVDIILCVIAIRLTFKESHESDAVETTVTRTVVMDKFGDVLNATETTVTKGGAK